MLSVNCKRLYKLWVLLAREILFGLSSLLECMILPDSVGAPKTRASGRGRRGTFFEFSIAALGPVPLPSLFWKSVSRTEGTL